MRALLVRHAESTWNATGRWQGQADVPLSPRGQLQARSLAGRLFGLEVDARLCSDLSRALETAAGLGAPPEPDRRLREIDVGAWAGRKRAEVAEAFADEVKALREGRPVRIGGGESMDEFEARVDALTDELLATYADQRLLVVTHGGVIRAIITRILDLRGAPSPIVGATNASLSDVEWADGALRLTRFNDAQHLDAGDQDSGIFSAYKPATRVALIASEAGATSERRLADGLLSSLGIARYYALAPSDGDQLAAHLIADRVEGDAPAEVLERLRAEHEMDAMALLASPEIVRQLTAGALGLSERGAEGLGLPPHGSVTQLRLTERGALLHSFAIPILL